MIRWITKKRQGELATFTMVYVLLFLVATVAFALQIREYISLKTHTEDTLAASNLASAVIDIQEYAYAVQMVQNTIDNLQAVNSDIQTTMDEIDTYMQRLNDTRSSLSTTHDKNEKIMQNFAKLLCVD